MFALPLLYATPFLCFRYLLADAILPPLMPFDYFRHYFAAITITPLRCRRRHYAIISSLLRSFRRCLSPLFTRPPNTLRHGYAIFRRFRHFRHYATRYYFDAMLLDMLLLLC